ncbi:Nucleoid-associated protein [bacterium HR32]|nr:Nucleoid-associated protein [bacterium HR32]
MRDMSRMLRQVQKMQEEFARVQQQLDGERVEATAGGGAIRVVADGHGRLVEVRIAREAVDPDDVETLEDLVRVAVNEAHARARELAEARLRGLTGGLGLPGLFP